MIYVLENQPQQVNHEWKQTHVLGTKAGSGLRYDLHSWLLWFRSPKPEARPEVVLRNKILG
jgi:hypothetical protein